MLTELLKKSAVCLLAIVLVTQLQGLSHAHTGDLNSAVECEFCNLSAGDDDVVIPATSVSATSADCLAVLKPNAAPYLTIYALAGHPRGPPSA